MSKPIDPAGPTNRPPEQRPDPPTKPEADAEEFSALLKKEGQSKESAEQRDRDAARSSQRRQDDARESAGERERGASSGPGDAILKRMQADRGAGAPPETARMGGTQPGISEIAQKIADRILVSSNSPAGDAEVRITLKDSVLGGTEIQIFRDQGQLQVRMLVPNADARAYLGEQQGALQNALTTKLKEDVRVEVRSEPQHDGQGQQEGRSRQQRSILDEWQPD